MPSKSRRKSAQVRRRRPTKAAPKVRSLKTRTGKILDILEATYPDARCALLHKDPFQLSVATILSAQCTDVRVNQVTPALFARYPSAEALAAAETTELESLIRSTGFFRAKAKNLMSFAKTLVATFGGAVPRKMADLVILPGIGRKTANVVLGHAFGVQEGIAVDTHVLRVSNRLGIAKGGDPVAVERQLMAVIPKERWTLTTDLLIFHGRKICGARRPFCGRCPIFALCRWESREAFAIPERPRQERRGP
jgi:endonuclease-3